MHKIIPWFIHNAVAANLLMLILVIGGILALPQIHQEEFPTLNVDAVQILTPYLGAAPEEVESAVCVRIEEAIKGNEGIDKILGFVLPDRNGDALGDGLTCLV